MEGKHGCFTYLFAAGRRFVTGPRYQPLPKAPVYSPPFILRKAGPVPMHTRASRWTVALLAARHGDAVAYAGFLQELAGFLRRFVTRQLALAGGGSSDAEDVVQEVLLAVHQQHARWDETRPLLPWLHAIVRYKINDACRRSSRDTRRHLDLDAQRWEALLGDEGASPEAQLDVVRLLAALPPRQQQLVRAVHLEGRSAREVADQFHSNEGAVRVTLHRALRRLSERARGDAR
ncbi:MAG: ECF RNA polymerase sigma factor SigF [Stenotrophomonas maltophilia]|uniref:ECF RNA polymerase sigma factor SigF n=1 Tax=Stenotrophomonas maltophilia TaxID=40324 RepID=A0A7V8FJ19_STEMA|nr:MAG: ECF RNA polymerase sigma factor SigF [Stenotrophomonas maltophilia]